MSYLQKLINKTVLSVDTGISQTYPIKIEKTGDDNSPSSVVEMYLQLIFEDYRLHIYNPGILRGNNDQSFKNLEKLKIISIVESEIEISFIFQDGTELRIDLRPEAYSGPEAMCLYGPNNLVVVWN